MVQKSRALLYVAFLTVALLSGGCALTPIVREPQPMEQMIWVLQSLNGVSPFSDVEITMEFHLNAQFPSVGVFNDVIRGHAVCNGYTVPYNLNDNRLIVDDIVTQSAEGCLPESHNNLEQQYFEILTQVESYELKDNILTLSTEDGMTLVFNPQTK